VRSQIESGQCRRLALVARTAADVRDTIVEGESGILAVSLPKFRPKWEPSKRRLTWPNGAIATTYTADEPDLLRGPQHDGAWADELAAWRYPEAWDQLQFGLRLGTRPRCVVTTTPRPTKIIRELRKHPGTRISTGSTYDNRANLAPSFVETIVRRFEGTRLGRQELYAEVLEDNPGALWKRDQIDAARVAKLPTDLVRIVVAIDPAVTSHEGSDETGIIVVGVDRTGHGFVIDDLTGRYKPQEWATVAVNAFGIHRANLIVGEINNGGEMVEHTIRTVNPRIPFKAVHASRGKRTRAEPISALYEQGKVHHVGSLPELEDQMCGWSAASNEKSPDRLDAAVWGLHELMVEPELSGVAIGFDIEF
jgi:predicted phage terminase large subunit-like protein